MQIAGSGFRVNADILKEEFDRPGELRNHLQRYIQGFLVQSAQTATCNRLHNIEERLARWMLSCRDRVESNQLRLTHDFLGQMLGAPRTTVTLAAGLLQRAGMIDYSPRSGDHQEAQATQQTTMLRSVLTETSLANSCTKL